MRTIHRLLTASTLGTLICLPASAHHSFNMFDQTTKVEITGKVADVQWTNPHVWIEVDVPEENGEVTRWGVEFTSRVHMTRRGWTSTTVNPGDEVTFTLSPYRDGRPGGRFWTVTLPTGETLRDPGAQREYEASLGATELSVDPASQPQDDVTARRAAALQVDRTRFRYAALDALPDLGGIWHPAFGRPGGTEPKLRASISKPGKPIRRLPPPIPASSRSDAARTASRSACRA
jgi:hypothetical protein